MVLPDMYGLSADLPVSLLIAQPASARLTRTRASFRYTRHRSALPDALQTYS